MLYNIQVDAKVMADTSGRACASSRVERWIREVQLKDGTSIHLRPEIKSDFPMLWEMYSTLTYTSLQFLPEPPTEERVRGWVENINYDRVIPILGVVRTIEGQKKIVASATLAFSNQQSTKHVADFGIVVHDDYQNKGLGTILTKYLLEIAKERGINRVTLKVVTENERAIHVYKKIGFKVEGKLVNNHYNYNTGQYGDDYIMAICL